MTRHLLTQALVLLALAAGAPSHALDRPHIVLIMADDIGIEGFGCYGGTSYETPRIDRLAAEGMRFTHAYSQPLCTPTRVQLMTGKYNHRNWTSFGILAPSETTFGHRLQKAGYQTAIAGKWQLRSYDPPDFPGAAKRRGTGMRVADAGFDEWHLFHTHETEDKGSRYADPTIDHNGELKAHAGAYGPDISVDSILGFLERAREDDRPEFVYYPMALPHWPVMPTPHSEVWESDPARRLEEDDRYFPDMVEYLDHCVGRLLDGLEKLGIADETIVLFYSDNGTHLSVTSELADGRRIAGGKATPAQTGIHVPLVARWPGKIEPGSVCHDLIDASDFLPTLADLAGIKVKDDWKADGQSFLPQLLGRPGTPREACFFWYDPRPGWDKDRFRRHVFALDHHHKLYRDGRFLALDPDRPLHEEPIEGRELTPEEAAAKAKLQAVIDQRMAGTEEPPLVDAFGEASAE